MALKVKAKQKLQKVGKYADTYRFVLSPELYIALAQNKVISEAALRSGISKGVMQACWDAAGEVIKAWATEGHSVALPGLGTMRFGLRAKSVATVDEVKSKLITSRKIIFTPSTDLKDELANTAIQITCYDKDGNELKRVTSTDEGIVEDPEGDETGESDGKTDGSNENENQNENGGSTNPEPGTVNPEPGNGGGGTEDGTDES
jgi:predicted histone-like DNA-binding protein